ncbi:hypothetical protein ALC152_19500 [Arcobacter sp. 15-2]|uniref:tetratricopeptide repeat protein n=1 Tax=Arcobacter sp. 15-2 TaxID=3374109 RepID=UPI00399CB15A
MSLAYMNQNYTQYNPNIFNKKDLDEAKRIILTHEKNITSEVRWENETPYLIDSISNKISFNGESLVVDFGCGIGRLSKELIEKFGCRVVGVDISPTMREHATQYVNSNKFQAISPKQYKNMIFQGVRFDTALAVWVLQHCIDPVSDIALIQSSLKENGSFFVLNNIQTAIPTNKGWVSNKLDIFSVLEDFFELEIKQKLPVSAGNEYISKHTFEALYKNTKMKQILQNSQIILQKARKAIDEKKYNEAIKLYLYGVKIYPLNYNAFNNLGILYEKLGDTKKAIMAYKNAVRVNPKFAKAINNIGVILYKEKNYDKSAKIFQIALDTDPSYYEVYSNMGAALNKAKKYEEAIKSLQTAIEKMPKHSGAYTNLGNVFNKLHEYKKASKCHEKSIELEADGYNAYSNLGTSYKNLGFTNKAIKSYKKAIELKPDFENAHFDLSTVYLSKGDFIHGLEEYEWRFRKEEMQSHIYKHKHIFSKPMMKKGEDIKGMTLLVHSEQGFGDSIMYARFLPQLKALGCTLAIECRDELKTLFESMKCIDIVVGRDEQNTPSFDLHLPIMSLAYILDVRGFSDFPTEPYFKVEKDEEFQLQNDKIKIGLCWSASATGESYDGKVFDLSHFEPLIKNPKIQIYSLQVGYGSEQIEHNGYENDMIDFTDKFSDFSKTASFMKELDLVISSDTSVAHLAGAIGVKTYTLLQKYPDWRWLNKGDTSYLYPSMKLFRQKQNRIWEAVFQSLFAKMDKEYKLKLKK